MARMTSVLVYSWSDIVLGKTKQQKVYVNRMSQVNGGDCVMRN